MGISVHGVGGHFGISPAVPIAHLVGRLVRVSFSDEWSFGSCCEVLLSSRGNGVATFDRFKKPLQLFGGLFL